MLQVKLKHLRDNYLLLYFLFLIFNAVKCALFVLLITKDKYFIFFIYNLLINFSLLVILLPALVKNRGIFGLFYFLQLVFMLISTGYYMYFDSYLSLTNLFQLFGEGIRAVDSISSIEGVSKLLFLFIDIVCFAALFQSLKKNSASIYRIPIYKGLIVCSILVVTMIELANYRIERSFIHFLKRPHKTEEVMVKRYGLLFNSIFDVKHRSNEQELMKSIKYGRLLASKGRLDKKSIILIQVESLDSAIITTKHNGRYVTPFLNKLRQRSVFFPYCMSYHAGGATSDAEFAALNGIEPFNKFIAMKMNRYTYPNSIFRPFNSAGFTSATFHVNRGDFFNRSVAYRKMEVGTFYDYFKMNIPPEQQQRWGASDEFLYNFSYKQLRQQQDKYFYYLITVSSHSPFQVISDFHKDASFDDIEKTIARDYFLSMSYVDKVTGEFVEKVRKENPDTYILIVGDHSPGKIEYGEYKSSRIMYKRNKYEFVPLFIITPDNLAHHEKKMAVSFLDIAPTVLNISGIPYSLYSFGEDLLVREWAEDLLKWGQRYDRVKIYNMISRAENMHKKKALQK